MNQDIDAKLEQALTIDNIIKRNSTIAKMFIHSSNPYLFHQYVEKLNYTEFGLFSKWPIMFQLQLDL